MCALWRRIKEDQVNSHWTSIIRHNLAPNKWCIGLHLKHTVDDEDPESLESKSTLRSVSVLFKSSLSVLDCWSTDLGRHWCRKLWHLLLIYMVEGTLVGDVVTSALFKQNFSPSIGQKFWDSGNRWELTVKRRTSLGEENLFASLGFGSDRHRGDAKQSYALANEFGSPELPRKEASAPLNCLMSVGYMVLPSKSKVETPLTQLCLRVKWRVQGVHTWTLSGIYPIWNSQIRHWLQKIDSQFSKVLQAPPNFHEEESHRRIDLSPLFSIWQKDERSASPRWALCGSRVTQI